MLDGELWPEISQGNLERKCINGLRWVLGNNRWHWQYWLSSSAVGLLVDTWLQHPFPSSHSFVIHVIRNVHVCQCVKCRERWESGTDSSWSALRSQHVMLWSLVCCLLSFFIIVSWTNFRIYTNSIRCNRNTWCLDHQESVRCCSCLYLYIGSPQRCREEMVCQGKKHFEQYIFTASKIYSSFCNPIDWTVDWVDRVCLS